LTSSRGDEINFLHNSMFKWLHCPYFAHCTLIVWISCLWYIFSKEATRIGPIQKWIPSCLKLKSRFQYTPRRKPKIMSWTSQTKQNSSNWIRQQQLKYPNMLNITDINPSLGMALSQRHHTNTKNHIDSYIMAIDNCCLYSMSNNKSNFKGGMSPCKVNIKGIGGINQITKSCTVSWTIEDDEWKPHELVILRTYKTWSRHITCINVLSTAESGQNHQKVCPHLNRSCKVMKSLNIQRR